MRSLITGANGFLGSWLARRLVQREGPLRCLVRAGSDDSGLAGLQLERAIGEVTRPQSLRAALEGVEVVFHLAATRRGATAEEFLQVNAEGTRNLCEQLARAGTRRLVLCSSLAASGPSSPTRPRVEEDPLCPEEWYGQSKAEAERIAFGFQHRFEVTCCRPCRILGPGDRENLSFFRMAKKGIALRLGGPPRLLSMVDVEDVVSLLLLLADRREAAGEAFFAAGPDTTTVEGLMRMIAGVLGVKPRTLPLPESLLGALGSGGDLLSRLTGRKLQLSRKLSRQLLAPGWTCSGQKAQRLLGFTPRVSLLQSAQRCADGYLRAGWL